MLTDSMMVQPSIVWRFVAVCLLLSLTMVQSIVRTRVLLDNRNASVIASMSSDFPSLVPSDVPSTLPSDIPSSLPSDIPSVLPSDVPSDLPSQSALRSRALLDNRNVKFVASIRSDTDVPPMVPSDVPSTLLSDVPSDLPSSLPSDIPSDLPMDVPSSLPYDTPSRFPSDEPSIVPSDLPSSLPSDIPSTSPSGIPSKIVFDDPSSSSSVMPSSGSTREASYILDLGTGSFDYQYVNLSISNGTNVSVIVQSNSEILMGSMLLHNRSKIRAPMEFSWWYDYFIETSKSKSNETVFDCTARHLKSINVTIDWSAMYYQTWLTPYYLETRWWKLNHTVTSPCVIKVNGTACSACTYCGETLFAGDCTNVAPYGQKFDCGVFNLTIERGQTYLLPINAQVFTDQLSSKTWKRSDLISDLNLLGSQGCGFPGWPCNYYEW